ncbi:hypothetical protein quinque_007718 [Culex quinquefasciatus]
MDVEKLKCVLCRKFPDGMVYECNRQRHIGCESCVEKLNVKLCQCSEYFDRKASNPIESLVRQSTNKVPCPYKKAGCTWLFGSSDMRSHLEECKFRPYRCIASKLNVLTCPWEGMQFQIEDHLMEDHAKLGDPFTYFQESEIPFSEQSSKGGIKLVDAFSKKFLFYFLSSAKARVAYFMIVYFGRREEARQYYYEFEIRSKSDSELRKIKFVQNCVSDCEDLSRCIVEEDCVAVSFKTIRHFLHEGTIPFRFIVKKKDDEPGKEGRERKLSDGSVTKPNKPRPTPFNFSEKGKLKPNLRRSTSSGSFSGGGGQSGPGKSGGAKKASEEAPSRKTSAPAQVGTSGVQRSPEFSSINRMGVSGQDSPIVHQEPCPLLTPSINRLDAPPSYMALTSTDFRQSTSEHSPAVVNRPPPGECKTTANVCRMYTQPYKTKDDRLYLQRYPTDCLSKPVFRR